MRHITLCQELCDGFIRVMHINRFSDRAAKSHQHALLVAQQFRLYPQIIAVEQIKAARIEAKLRLRQATDEDKVPAPTYYLDVADSRTN